MKKLILISLLFLTFLSCRKAETKGRYFVFGTSCGQCSGDPMTYFIIKNGQLYPDNMETNSQDLSFKKDKLSRDKYKIAKELIEKLPDLLENSSSQSFGCTNCADGGHYFIQIGKHSSVKTFHIYDPLSSQPDEIQEYVVLLRSVLEKLK